MEMEEDSCGTDGQTDRGTKGQRDVVSEVKGQFKI